MVVMMLVVMPRRAGSGRPVGVQVEVVPMFGRGVDV